MTMTINEPIPTVVPELVKPELPEHITRMMDAVDSAWTEQTMLVRLLNAINYPLYERDGVATVDELQNIQRLAYDVMRYAGYIDQQIRYTLYIMGHDVHHTVTVEPVPTPEPEVTTE